MALLYFQVCVDFQIVLSFYLVFRGLQGFLVLGLVALSQALVVDIFSIKNRSKAISAWTFGFSRTSNRSIIGRFIIESYSWRLIFFINVPLGMILFWADNFWRKNLNIKVKVNFLGFIFLSFSAGSIQILLDRGELLDWFSLIILYFYFCSQ